MKRLHIMMMAVACSLSSVYAVDMKIQKGQRYYLQNCKECHGKGNRGGGLASMEGWDNYFKNDGAKLIAFHPDQPDVVTYLKSDTFKKHQKSMLPFLREFATDSPSIPSCNN